MNDKGSPGNLDQKATTQIVTLQGGIVVEIQGPLPYQQRHWVKHQFYEQSLLEYIREHYHGGAFIDGGACIGNHTLWFARFCAEQAIAVEPVERNMAHLITNVTLSGLSDKVVTVTAALGETAGRGAMKTQGPHHGGWELVDGDEVEITTLNEVGKLAAYPVALIKLDIQGSELSALKGGVDLLNEYGPVIIAEAWNEREAIETSAFLATLGYTLVLRKRNNYLFTRAR